MTWNRKAGVRTEICIRCGERPPAAAKRRCKQCLAEMEQDRRERLLADGDGKPCSVDGCDKPRYRIPSQWSSYCYEHHLASRRKARLKYAYGLSLEQYEELLARASHSCEICSGTHRLVVDHCHKTGAVRGILCDPHNKMLGNADDDPRALVAGAFYLLAFLGRVERPAPRVHDIDIDRLLELLPYS